LFLLAGLSVAIPLLIHLFNLRRYKTVYFPHTRFLKAIQLRSRKSRELRYKVLLALRMLFLLALVAAFAQPFFMKKKAADSRPALQIIYIDNNPALGIKSGLRTGLDRAVEAARRQIQSSPAGTRFYLLSNDRAFSYEPLPADKAAEALLQFHTSPVSRNSAQVFATVQSLLQTESAGTADLFYYSNFARGSFSAHPDESSRKNIRLHAVAVQPEERKNIYIDTAFLAAPLLQTDQQNAVIVRSRMVGKAPADAPVLQLSVDGQVKSAASLRFDETGKSLDTLSFTVSETGWRHIQLHLSDASLPFDDTFRLAARSAPMLSVLVLNQQSASPYILAAFRSYSGFSVRELPLEQAPDDWSEFSLVILNGITALPDRIGKSLKDALEKGQSVCLFPERTSNPEALNQALAYAGDIRITALDTSSQTATDLQEGADLVRDIFDDIPANVQLPVSNWHYSIQSGLSAGGQSVISFRNGDPLLARYSPSEGFFYLSASSADMDAGNFPASFFFVPFLYQMAAQSRGGDVYALTAGSQQAAFLPMRQSSEQNMVHLYGSGLDAIPPQRSRGGGLDVFVDAVVQTPGFYRLAAPNADTADIALNGTRSYSGLDLWKISELQSEWPDGSAQWLTASDAAAGAESTGGGLPLWKVCTILALLLVAAETWLLASRKSIPSPEPVTN
jgi:hypothetical protein